MKRWPIIRHVRYFWNLYQMNKHYDLWRSLGSLPVNIDSDLAVLDEIWAGKR